MLHENSQQQQLGEVSTEVYFDRLTANEFLRAIGYREGDRVWVRAINEVTNDNYRTVEPEASYPISEEQAEALSFLQCQGYSLHLVANGNGFKKEDHVDKWQRAIILDFDNISLDEVSETFKKFDIKPTVVYSTGGRGWHVVIAFKGTISTETWVELTEKLIAATGADKAIKHPSHLTALPGSGYIRKRTGGKFNGKYAEIVPELSTYEPMALGDLHDRVPRLPKAPEPAPIAPPLPPVKRVVDSGLNYSLMLMISREHRELITKGMIPGSRNTTATKVALDLIGCENFAAAHGIPLSDSSYDLFIQFCQQCFREIGDGWNQQEWDTIYNSAKKHNPRPCTDADKLIENYQTWLRKNSPSVPVNSPNKASSTENKSKDTVTVLDCLEEIYKLGLAGSGLKKALGDTADRFRRSLSETQQRYDALAADYERKEYDTENRNEIERLADYQAKRLDITRYLPGSLGKAIEQVAELTGMYPESYFLSLLVALSSMHRPGSKIVLYEGTDFAPSLNLWGAIIAESGAGKSPMLSTIVEKPLAALQAKVDEEYREALQQYQTELEYYESIEPEQRKEHKIRRPKEPVAHYYFSTFSTCQGLVEQLAKMSRGHLQLFDELSSWWEQLDKFSKGDKGGDLEFYLTAFGGRGGRQMKVKGVVTYASTNVALLGGTQPHTLREKMAGAIDDRGLWARWLLVQQPTRFVPWSGNGKHKHNTHALDVLLSAVYQKFSVLGQQDPLTLTLSDEAYEIFCDARDQLLLLVTDPETPINMQHYHKKSVDRLGKFAANLHILLSTLNGDSLYSTEVSAEVMQKAIELNDYFTAQTYLIYSEFGMMQTIMTDLQKVLKLSEKNPDQWLKARDICRGIHKTPRVTSEQAREWIEELHRLGFVEIRSGGRKIEFRVKH